MIEFLMVYLSSMTIFPLILFQKINKIVKLSFIKINV